MPAVSYALRGEGNVGARILDRKPSELCITGRALRDHFAEVNGCTPQTPPEPATGSGTHICTTYDGCMAGFPVRWCAHDGGHTAAPTDRGQAMTWVPQEAWTLLKQF